MKTTCRARAPTAPPVSGASSKWRSAATKRSPTWRTVAGALVVRSTSTAPRGAVSSHRRATVSITAGVGSDVKVSSLRSATSAGLATTVAPAATSGPQRRASGSWTTTRWPSATRFMAMAPPMLPAPITPSRCPFARNSAGRLARDGRRPLEAVEAGRILPENLPLRPLRERPHRNELADRVRELAVPVRIVAAEHDEVVPERVHDVFRPALVDLGRHEALALEVLARLHAEVGRVARAEPALPVLVHALEPPGGPARARREEDAAEPRVPLEHAADDQVHARAHVLDRVADQVELHQLVVAAAAELGEVHAGALVRRERHAEPLDLGVEGVEVRVVDGAAVHGIRPDEDRAHPELLDRVNRLGDRDARVVQRDERRADEPLRRARAEVGEPAVVRPADRAGEARRKLVHRGGIEAARGVEDGDVDALDVERLELALGVEVASGREAVARRRARRVVGRLEGQTARYVGQHVAEHFHAEDADAARRLVAELGIDVALPQVDGLEHVAVGVDHAVVLVHGALLRGAWGASTAQAALTRQPCRARTARSSRSRVRTTNTARGRSSTRSRGG